MARVVVFGPDGCKASTVNVITSHGLKLHGGTKHASSASSPPGFGGKAGRKANVISIASPRFFKTDSEHHQHHRLLFRGGSWQEKQASSLLSSSPATWKQAAMMLMMLSVRSEKPRGGAPDNSRGTTFYLKATGDDADDAHVFCVL